MIGKEVLRSEVVRKSMSRMKKFIPSQLPTHPAQPILPAHNSSIFDPPSLNRRLASSKADLSGMPVPPSSQIYSGEGGTWHTQQTSLLAVGVTLSTLAIASHFVSIGAASSSLLWEAAELLAVILVLLLAIGFGDQERWTSYGMIRYSSVGPRVRWGSCTFEDSRLWIDDNSNLWVTCCYRVSDCS